jgi:hypothetical protein
MGRSHSPSGSALGLHVSCVHVPRRGDARPSTVVDLRRQRCVVVEGLRAWLLGRSDRRSGSPPRCCSLPPAMRNARLPVRGRPQPPSRREDGHARDGQPLRCVSEVAGESGRLRPGASSSGALKMVRLSGFAPRSAALGTVRVLSLRLPGSSCRGIGRGSGGLRPFAT